MKAGILARTLKWRYKIICSLFLVACLLPDRYVQARTVRIEIEEDIRPFRIRELNGSFDLGLEYEDDSTGSSYQEKRTRLEERLNLLTRGSIYHTNLLEFELGTSIGLGQEMSRGNFKGNDNSFVNEYNLNLGFLRKKPYNFTLFAEHSSDTAGRQYFSPIRIDHDSYGGVARYQTLRYSASLTVSNQRTKEKSDDFTRDRKEKSADLRFTFQPAADFNNELRYLFRDTKEQLTTNQSLTTHDLSLYSLWDKGDLHGISMLSWIGMSGSVETNNFRANESFHMDHSDYFTTLYNYNFSSFQATGYESESHLGSAGFRYKLYESLTTEARYEGGVTKATDFHETYHGPTLNLTYVKNVPGGFITAGYGFLYRRTDRETSGGSIKVYAEAITLSDGQRTVLSHPNVILASVVVRDIYGGVLIEDIDYRLITTGLITEIQRIALPNDTPVLVDYDYSSALPLSYDTISHSLNFRYDFKQFLSYYHNYLNMSYGDISGAGHSAMETSLYDVKKNLDGVELRWRDFLLGAEYEVDDSDLTPFTAWRVRGSFSRPLTDYASLGIGANHTETDYKHENYTMTMTDVSLNLRAFLFGRVESSLESGYLVQKGRDTDTRAFRVKGDLKGRFRAVELTLTAEYLNRNEYSQNRNDFQLLFNIVRYFKVL